MGAARDRVAVGRVGRPHGVKGLVHVRPYTAAPEGIAAYGPVETADGRRLEVTVVAVNKADVTARIAGVADRDAAAALTGQELFVPRSALPEPEEDEFYRHDLIGLQAVSVAGEDLGRITAVHDFGAGCVLEIEGGDRGGVLLPFTAEAVPEVDVEGGRITVDPPPGLWDAGEGPDEGPDEGKE